MENIVGDTLEKIKKQNITPQPRWKYVLRKYGVWLLAGMVIGLAAISFSAGFGAVYQLDWDLYRFTHRHPLFYFFSLLPYFWIILTVVFLLAAFFEIRRTETGYRYSGGKISKIILASFVLIGAITILLGAGLRLHMALESRLPFYRHNMMVTKESQWMQPEKGFLAGTIQSRYDENLKLEDLNKEEWEVKIQKETIVRPSVSLTEKEMIKIIGEEKEDRVFEAREIRPWTGHRAGKMKDGGLRRNQMGIMKNKNKQ